MSTDSACDSSATESPSLPWAGVDMDRGEPDLAYLLTAQMLVRRDKAAAMSRLGIRLELAELLEQLSPRQIARIAALRWLCDLSLADIGARECPDPPHRIATICD
ncbi:flagellar transcriptional regulator FlhD [Variovorax sp. LT2P21]|uniref:flagellar transcriptional regulator FlhD n=1 Tax=Variovorax sp. LT2P21 TaxID=3443731 RepID=UPI003F475202